MFFNQNRFDPNNVLPVAMATFYYSTRISIRFFDYKSKETTAYPLGLANHPCPSEDIKDFLQTIDMEIFNYKDNYHFKINTYENYLIHPYRRQGHHGILIAGPYLNQEIGIRELNKISETNQLSIKQKNDLRKYFSTLPITQPHQTQFFKIFLSSLTKIDSSDIPTFIEYNNGNEKPIQTTKYYIESYKNWQFNFIHHTYKDEETFYDNLFSSKNEEEVSKIIENNTILSYETIPNLCLYDELRSLKNLLIASITVISRFAIKKGLDSETSFTYSDLFIQQVELLKDKMEITNHLKTIIYTYYRLINNKNKKKVSPLIHQALKITESQSKNDITLSGLAKILNCNASYLSTQFKKEMGISFKNYIIEKKITIAKNMLKNSNVAIVEIADYLDFNTVSHFSSIFKKYTQLSPSQYRKDKSIS